MRAYFISRFLHKWKRLAKVKAPGMRCGFLYILRVKVERSIQFERARNAIINHCVIRNATEGE